MRLPHQGLHCPRHAQDLHVVQRGIYFPLMPWTPHQFLLWLSVSAPIVLPPNRSAVSGWEPRVEDIAESGPINRKSPLDRDLRPLPGNALIASTLRHGSGDAADHVRVEHARNHVVRRQTLVVDRIGNGLRRRNFHLARDV